jgi:hypothetical protein
MQSVEVGLGILVDDTIRDDDRPSLVRCPETVKTEATRETGN